MRDLMNKVLPAVIMFVMAGVVTAVPPGLRPGDGMGLIDRYDRGQQTVSIGRQQVGLLPTAAASLDQQLQQLGVGATQSFAAKFNVMPSGDGQLLIESIYVVPPKNLLKR